MGVGTLFRLSIPRLGGAGANNNPVNPCSGTYPYCNKGRGGWTVFPGQTPYSLWELMNDRQPVRGHVYRQSTTMGDTRRRSFDLDRHFYTADRYSVLSIPDIIRIFCAYSFAMRPVIVAMWVLLFFLPYIRYHLQITEPLEMCMDRGAFLKNYQSLYQGYKHDHHAWHHQIMARRANKWGYYGVLLGDEDGHSEYSKDLHNTLTC